jgi:hypothetical protein
MAKSNVVNIKPAVQKMRAPKPFEFPKEISEALWQQQLSVYEALGVAKLLASYLADRGSADNLEIDVLDNSASALVRLLEPIDSLSNAKDLLNTDEVAHG